MVMGFVTPRSGWRLPPRPVIQAKGPPAIPRVYPNLNPSAAVPVDADQIFHLNSFCSHYRLARGKEHGQYVPNTRYIFVRTIVGEMLLHPTYRHPAIAQGKPVLYAGEMYFDNGTLQWWSNGSGNYRPDPEHAEQAGLPMDQFFTFDQIIKGEHKQSEAVRKSELVQAKFPSGWNRLKGRY